MRQKYFNFHLIVGNVFNQNALGCVNRYYFKHCLITQQCFIIVRWGSKFILN